MIMYGIRSCDTIRKARAWLDAAGVAYEFHDYKVAGVDAAALDRWVDRLGWTVLLNRAGTTFRALPDAARADLDRDRAVALMLASPSSIKRPVIEDGDTLVVGFSADRYAAAFG